MTNIETEVTDIKQDKVDISEKLDELLNERQIISIRFLHCHAEVERSIWDYGAYRQEGSALPRLFPGTSGLLQDDILRQHPPLHKVGW